MCSRQITTGLKVARLLGGLTTPRSPRCLNTNGNVTVCEGWVAGVFCAVSCLPFYIADKCGAKNYGVLLCDKH